METNKDWSIGDYLEHFEKEIKRSSDEEFKSRFHALSGELALMDSQFLVEAKECSKDIYSLLDQLHSISGRLGYCRTPRDFKDECESIYGDMDKLINLVRDFRDTCTN